jgi:hypothetical protein
VQEEQGRHAGGVMCRRSRGAAGDVMCRVHIAGRTPTQQLMQEQGRHERHAEREQSQH